MNQPSSNDGDRRLSEQLVRARTELEAAIKMLEATKQATPDDIAAIVARVRAAALCLLQLESAID